MPRVRILKKPNFNPSNLQFKNSFEFGNTKEMNRYLSWFEDKFTKDFELKSLPTCAKLIIKS